MLASSQSKGKSADTWKGFLDFMIAHGAAWAIIENSDMLLEDDSGDCVDLLAALASDGYFAWPCIFDSKEYGTPMARRRAYILVVARSRSQPE